jgi:hypothetical protein
MVSMKQLRRFVKLRNESSYFTNLQFLSDAGACGFEPAALGDVRKFTLDGFDGYEWNVPLKEGGIEIMLEFGRKLYLCSNNDPDTDSMIALWKDEAVYLQAA